MLIWINGKSERGPHHLCECSDLDLESVLCLLQWPWHQYQGEYRHNVRALPVLTSLSYTDLVQAFSYQFWFLKKHIYFWDWFKFWIFMLTFVPEFKLFAFWLREAWILLFCCIQTFFNIEWGLCMLLEVAVVQIDLDIFLNVTSFWILWVVIFKCASTRF